MKIWLTMIQQSAAAFWSVRDARERRMLLIAAAVVVAALYYLLLIAPALTGRELLARNTPQLREQVAQLQALSTRATGLTGKTETSVAVMNKETLTAALAAHGLKAKTVSVTGELAQIQLAGVSFTNTLGLLDELQKSSRISVSETKITALPLPDQIDATFTLRQSRNP